MSRNRELEAVLQALYELDTCVRDQRDVCLARYHEALDRAIAGGAVPNLTRAQAQEALRGPYREFRRAKRLEERAKLSRLR